MFPHPQNFPADFFVVTINFFVPLPIPFYLFRPVFFPCGWQAAMFFAPVPKARINEYNDFVLFQN